MLTENNYYTMHKIYLTKNLQWFSTKKKANFAKDIAF
jgi:hypothetical protein